MRADKWADNTITGRLLGTSERHQGWQRGYGTE
nr:MAG TPA: hypothetical protein [Caudoviricetes sp.]